MVAATGLQLSHIAIRLLSVIFISSSFSLLRVGFFLFVHRIAFKIQNVSSIILNSFV